MRYRFSVRPVLAGLVALVICGGMLAVSGCGSESDSGSTSASGTNASKTIPHLNVGLFYALPTINPTKSLSLYEILALSLEQLERVDENGELVPALAEKVTQPSPTEYVYTLRPGVRFWNGNELTAEDVAFTWNYYRKPPSLIAQNFQTVKSVEATGEDTVKVTLKEPNAGWRQQVAAAPGIFEKQFFEQSKGRFGQPGTLIMGTGPWQWDSLNPTTGAELSANRDYWGGPVNVDRISLKFYSDETGVALAYRSGDVDVAFPSDARGFESSAGVDITESVPSTNPILLSLNTVAAPWDDVHVRRAVAYALNREDIIKAYGVDVEPLDTIIPPAQLDTLAPRAAVDEMLASLPQYPHDLEKAKEEMAQSRYPDGAKAEFNTLAGYGFRDMAQVMKQQLAEIGIDLDVRILETSRWVALVTGADREKIGLQLIQPGGTSADPSKIPSQVLGSANVAPGQQNVANWAPADVDRLIKEGLQTSDGSERLAIYGELLTQVGTELPYFPITLAPNNLVLRDDLTWPTFSFAYYSNPWPLEIQPR